MRTARNSLEKTAGGAILMTMAALLAAPAAAQEPLGKEAERVIETILAPPTIKAEPGFDAKLLVPPGELYDPLYMIPHDGSIWMNDDGKAEEDHGSRILSFAPDGTFSVLFDADQILPAVGFTVAPAGFGPYGGQIFTLAQPTTGMKGGLANHVIQRIDPATGETSIFCTLPSSGTVGDGVAGFGTAIAPGPPGSGFANKLFAITILNRMIYQITPDGACQPFADLSDTGVDSLAFTPDGSAMLVTGTPNSAMDQAEGAHGAIMRIAPDGKLDPKPVATGLKMPMGLAVAPPDFGSYGGEIFVLDAGTFEVPVPQTQASRFDGKVYRVTPQGELKLVASGFANPGALLFTGGHLWVSDVNGDFIGGGRELPDGFLVQIDPK